MVVRKLDLIACNYLKHWLIFDLLSLFPFVFFRDYTFLYYFRLSRVFKLTRVIDFFDDSGLGIFVNKCAKTSEMDLPTKTKFDALGKFFELLLLLLFASYATGCFWYWYVELVDNEEYSDSNFIDDAIMAKIGDDGSEVSGMEQMLVTMYFILTTLTTVGYGDSLTPMNSNEYALMIWIMLMGVTFFAYAVEEIKSRTQVLF